MNIKDITNTELTDKLKKIETENAGYKKTIAERDGFIDTLSKQKVQLTNQLALIQQDVTLIQKERDTALNQLQSSQKSLTSLQTQLSQRDETIQNLQKRISTLETGSITDETLRTDLEQTRLKYSQMSKVLDQKETTLAQIQNDFASIQYSYNSLKSESVKLNQLFSEMQQQKNTLQQELSTLNQKLQGSFSPDNLATYLTRTIDSFNGQTNVSDASINYVINEMDVELKASVGKNDKNEMILAAPNLAASNENALSTIKISIRSVPKE